MPNKALEANAGKSLPNIAEAESLVQEIHHLLVHSETALDDENAKTDAETLERWLESYLRGMSAAEKITKNSDVLLNDIRKRLALALEEMQRLDDEGNGAPVPKEQKQRQDAVSRAIKHIDRLIGSMSETFSRTEEAKPEGSRA